MTISSVKIDKTELEKDCSHQWQHLWREDCQAVLICVNCKQEKEIDDPAFLKQMESDLLNIRQQYWDLAQKSKKARAKDLMSGVKDKDEQLAWVRQKLDSLSEVSKKNQTVSVEVVDSSDELELLDPQEAQDLLHLERQVERGLYQSWKALAEIRERRLYRSKYKTFEQYCQDRFGYTRAAASYKIAASAVVDNLLTNGLQKSEMDLMPTSERQVRPMVGLSPSQQAEVWQEAVETAGGKIPSGRIVKDIVQRIREKNPVPNPFKEGEVCSILVKENPDLRGLGGCWAIVVEVREFGCQVQTFKGEVSVRIENLKPMHYSEQERKEMQSICERILRLRASGISEESIRGFLGLLGKIKRPFLTPKEEALLSHLEEICGVNQEAKDALLILLRLKN